MQHSTVATPIVLALSCFQGTTRYCQAFLLTTDQACTRRPPRKERYHQRIYRSGLWCRSEQKARLRYCSSHLFLRQPQLIQQELVLFPQQVDLIGQRSLRPLVLRRLGLLYGISNGHRRRRLCVGVPPPAVARRARDAAATVVTTPRTVAAAAATIWIDRVCDVV